jgi:hypothetical protein
MRQKSARALQMTCPEYTRLPDAYEATLRRWANMMRLPDETGWNKSIAFHRRDAAFAGMTVRLTTLTKSGCALESEWSNQLRLRLFFRRLWKLRGL